MTRAFDGATLRSWRQDRGYTLQVLAARLEVSIATVWRWEQGRSQPMRVFAKRVARLMAQTNKGGSR